MENVYEYRMGIGHRLTWLAAIAVAALLAFAMDNQDPLILGTVWGLCAAIIIWFLSRSLVAGIRVDDRYFTLTAWRDPKPVPLEDIDYLCMTHWTENSDVMLVYADGTEQHIPAGDLPDIQLSSEVMA